MRLSPRRVDYKTGSPWTTLPKNGLPRMGPAMSIKEKPLINAVSKLGPLPSFLFSNMVFVGFFAMIMCAVFFAVFIWFQAAGRGTVDSLYLYELARWGAMGGLIFGSIIYVGIAISAFRTPEEKNVRLLFVFGGVLAIVFLTVVDFLVLDALRDWFTAAGSIV